jgi:hypothetical protein
MPRRRNGTRKRNNALLRRFIDFHRSPRSWSIPEGRFETMLKKPPAYQADRIIADLQQGGNLACLPAFMQKS